nr:MAG TPA: hypothetical protein [Caudoviricetes sp.]
MYLLSLRFNTFTLFNRFLYSKQLIMNHIIVHFI